MARQIKTELVVKDKGSKTVKKFSDTSRAAMSKLAGIVGVAGVTASFTALIKKTIDYGDKLHKLNLRLGVSVTEMDKLRKIGELAGVEFNTIGMAMQRMTRRVQEAAQGSGVAADALKQLRLDASQLAKLRPDEQFRLVAQQLEKVKNQSEKVALAFKLFDSEGVRVLQMTKDLNKNLKNTTSEMSQQKVEQMAAFNDTMTKLKQTFEDFAIQVFPLLDKALQNITTTIKFVMGIFEDVNDEWVTADKNVAVLTETLRKLTAQREELANSNAPQKDRMLEANQKAIDNTIRKLAELKRKRDEVLGNKGGGAKVTPMDLPFIPAPPVAEIMELAEPKVKEWSEKHAMKYAETFNEKLVNEMRSLRDKGIDDALNAYFGDIDEMTSKMAELAEKEEAEAQKRKEMIQRTQEFFASSFADTFTDIITGAKDAKTAFKDMIGSMLRDLARMAAQKAFMMLLGSMGGGAGGGIFASIGTIFGMAGGGQAQGGRPYIVGERGPELFVPNQSGTVVPNGAMGGVSVSVNVDASNSNVGDPAKAQELGNNIARIVDYRVKTILAQEKRYGGILRSERRYG